MKNFNYKYTVRDFIDKNKWSNVYFGINNETSEKIILNILINVEGNENNLEQFKEEVNILKNINSSNVISINDMSTYINKDKTYYYIESENFEGLTLDELIRIKKLHETQCLQIIREVINGVKEFNNKKINFRDLTLENIRINGEGIVKVDTLSFINNHKGHINCKNHDLKKFDGYGDVYAIGSILCEMITNEKSFNPEKYKHLDENVIEILEKSNNKKCISKHKYKNLNEFLDDINLYLDGEEINYRRIVNFNKVHKLNSDFKIKKYIAIVFGVIVLFCVTTFGLQYLNNRNIDNVETTDKSRNIDRKEESSHENNIQDINPTEENLITPKETSESNEEENNKNKDDLDDNDDKEDNDSDNLDDNDNDNLDDNDDKEDNGNDNLDDNDDKEDNDNDNDNLDDNDDKEDNDNDKEKPSNDDSENNNSENNNSNDEKLDQNLDKDLDTNNNKVQNIESK